MKTYNEEVYPELAEETAWLNKKFTLEKLLYESSLDTLSDSLLTDFKDSARYANLGQIVETEQNLKLGNYAIAQALSDNLSPENQLETNFKIYNSIYTAWQMNPEIALTDAQIADLNYVAYQCYNTGGESVLQARGLLDYFFSNHSVYPDNCNTETSSARIKSFDQNNLISKPKVTSYEKLSVSISPNPASQSIRIISSDYDGIFDLQICNTIGIVILEKHNLRADCLINLEGIVTGSYTCKVTNSNGMMQILKLVLVN